MVAYKRIKHTDYDRKNADYESSKDQDKKKKGNKREKGKDSGKGKGKNQEDGLRIMSDDVKERLA